MAAAVEVLCPNGHRQKVKTTPNTTILQVLEEVCTKKNFLPPEEFELKHGRKTLDVSQMIRFAGLPNHAKLELVKSREARAESEVTLALQVDTGERLQQAFLPTSSLWDVLTHWEELPNSQHKDKLTKSRESGTTPVCAYMREEVIGEFALRETTLRTLGLTGGRAVIRLTHRQVEEATLASIEDKIRREKARQAKMTAKGARAATPPQTTDPVSAQVSDVPTTSSSSTSLKSSISDSSKVSLMDTESSGNVVQKTPAGAPSASSSEPILAQTQTEARAEEPMETDDVKQRKFSEQPMEEIVTRGCQVARDDVSGVIVPGRRPPTSGQPDLSALENLPGVNVVRPDDFHDLSAEEQQQARAMAAEMFPHLFPHGLGHGGRPRQQPKPRPPPQPQQPVAPFADFKFPEETKGKDLYRNDLSAFRKEDYEPCDRETVLFSLDEVRPDKSADDGEEIPDDFFEVTVNDLRSMWTGLQKKAESFGDQPLMTSEMRQQAKEAKMAKYQRVVLRVQFPDRLVLQGIFRPREPVYALEKFVKAHLEDKTSSFYLYTTPPRCVLKDKAETLFDADLVPMTLIHFGSDTQRDPYLSSAALAELATQEAANRVVVKNMSNRATSDGPVAGSSGNVTKHSKISDASTSVQAGTSGSKGDAKKVPKWFKMGKK